MERTSGKNKKQAEPMTAGSEDGEEVDNEQIIGKHGKGGEVASESDGASGVDQSGAREDNAINTSAQNSVVASASADQNRDPGQHETSVQPIGNIEAAARAFEKLYPGAYDLIKAGGYRYHPPPRTHGAAAVRPRDSAQSMSDRFAAAASAAARVEREKRFKAAEQAIADEDRLTNTHHSTKAQHDGAAAEERCFMDRMSVRELALFGNVQSVQEHETTPNKDGASIAPPTGPNYALNSIDPVNMNEDCLGD